MKQLLISMLTVFSFYFSHAQLEKSNSLLEGSFNISGNSRTEDFRTFGGIGEFENRGNFIFIAPRVGWFTTNNSLFGVGLVYQSNTNKSFSFTNGTRTSTFITRNNLFAINPYYRKFSQLTDKLYLTTTVDAAIGFGKEKNDNDGQDIESNIFNASLTVSPGLTYFISDKWAIQTSVGQLFYQFRQSTLQTDLGQQGDPKNESNNYGVSLNLNTFRIGLQYFLSRKAG
ncbi:MAG: hypothetical protein R8G66_02370 [Cytophagales bacterium]|nr:hypothetical protein [Cytophagales bacterium]